MKVMDCQVSIWKELGQDKWQVFLQYEDGSEYLSKQRYPTPEEAKEAALKWAAENAVDRSEAVH